MTGGWQSQFERVCRWHARLHAASTPEDCLDYLYAFFESAFALRDWLIDSGAASRQAVSGLFDSNEDMKLCRDLANSHKHRSLRSPSQPHPPSEALEYSPRCGNLGSDHSLVILSNGRKHDAVQLADRVLSGWQIFLESTVK
jgi:hypothetical protein